jgi:hypothetical protein
MILGVVLVLLALSSQGTAAPIDGGAISVADGDTIRVSGEPSAVRLVGFNTPETRRLRQIVAGGGLDLTLVRCACAPGTEGSPRCNYGPAAACCDREDGMLARSS